jgi:hypothetical protein
MRINCLAASGSSAEASANGWSDRTVSLDWYSAFESRLIGGRYREGSGHCWFRNSALAPPRDVLLRFASGGTTSESGRPVFLQSLAQRLSHERSSHVYQHRDRIVAGPSWESEWPWARRRAPAVAYPLLPIRCCLSAVAYPLLPIRCCLSAVAYPLLAAVVPSPRDRIVLYAHKPLAKRLIRGDIATKLLKIKINKVKFCNLLRSEKIGSGNRRGNSTEGRGRKEHDRHASRRSLP